MKVRWPIAKTVGVLLAGTGPGEPDDPLLQIHLPLTVDGPQRLRLDLTSRATIGRTDPVQRRLLFGPRGARRRWLPDFEQDQEPRP